jgi:cyclase
MVATMTHFRLEQVADDAWAAVSVPNTGSVANAGIVRSGDTTIVFDTFVTPQAARDLRAAAEEIAPIARVINSHWHGDHVRGNMAFVDLPIAATRRTRELIESEGIPQLEDMKRADKQEFLDRGGTQAEIANTIDDLEQTLPTELFDERLDLDGVVVETLGGGHTESDAFLTIGDVVFAGDLVVVRTHPWVGHGDPEHWIEILDALEERAPRVVVPGHGPVGSVEDVAAVRGYLHALVADPGLEPRGDWEMREVHERNVEFMRSR